MPTIKRDEKKEEKAGPSALQAQVNEIAATVRRLIKRAEQHWGEDLDNDGKVGGVRIGALAAVLAVSLIAGVVLAETVTHPIFGSTYGTASFSGDSSTATATLTVDAIVGDITGDITGNVTGNLTGDMTGDDITASGADTASLDVNIPASTNVQQGTITVKSAAAVANMDDGDYIEYNLIQAYDSATAACDYVYMRAVADDVTTATQDGALEIYVEVNSTATKVLDLDASGAAVAGAVDANNITVDAGAGIDNQAAGTLVVGASTATKVEIADSGVETEVQGPIDLQGTITVTDTTAAGVVTPAATNAPALVSTTDAVYLNVTISGEVYVITAYQLDD
jgi:hypothetical protein